MQLFFHFPAEITLKKRKPLRAFIFKKLMSEGLLNASLSIVFCSDNYLLQINQGFLQHDYFTDIVTFDFGSTNKTIAGELYISVDRVRENAAKFGTSQNIELHRVIFHGILHLVGYGDKSKKERSHIRKTEAEWLSAYFKKKFHVEHW
jgi:probable rRNA maturation factor